MYEVHSEAIARRLSEAHTHPLTSSRPSGATMKRTIATLAIALAATLTAVAPAQADEAVKKPQPCEFEVPDLPGECLTKVVYEYILGVQHDRDDAREGLAFADQQVTTLRENLALAQVNANYWHTTSDHNAAELVSTRQSLSIALSDVQSAYDQIDRLTLRVTAQRATIKRLRDRLHDLP